MKSVFVALVCTLSAPAFADCNRQQIQQDIDSTQSMIWDAPTKAAKKAELTQLENEFQARIPVFEAKAGQTIDVAAARNAAVAEMASSMGPFSIGGANLGVISEHIEEVTASGAYAGLYKFSADELEAQMRGIAERGKAVREEMQGQESLKQSITALVLKRNSCN